MIISRTPLRISFLGGGTDLAAFYNEEEGAVLSTTIDKYIYITINDRFDVALQDLQAIIRVNRLKTQSQLQRHAALVQTLT